MASRLAAWACLSFATSEIAADEIAAKNQPPVQRAENLNRHKGQGHSFWYQSISHIRVPIG